MQITTIGLDIARNVFQVLCIDAAEKVVVTPVPQISHHATVAEMCPPLRPVRRLEPNVRCHSTQKSPCAGPLS